MQNNNTHTREIIHFREKAQVAQAVNRFKRNRKGGGDKSQEDSRGMDYNGNNFNRGVTNIVPIFLGRENPNDGKGNEGREGRDGRDSRDSNADGGGGKKGFWGARMGLKNLFGRGNKDKPYGDDPGPDEDSEQRRRGSGRDGPRGDPFKGAGKGAATIAALKARAKKNNNAVSPLNFDDEGYYEDDEPGDNSGDLTARDIRLFSKPPGRNSNPDLGRNASVPVLDKRFNRDISGVDLYLEDEDDVDNDDNFVHPPPAPRFQIGDDAPEDLPSELGSKGGIPLGADGDDAAFF